MLTVLALLQLACYKDKGNYDYNPVVAPGIANLDTLYDIAIGDTLVVKPTVTTTDPKARFYFSWRISIPKQVRDTTLTGNPLTFIFNLDPDTYPVRLTITDSSNGMKYFMTEIGIKIVSSPISPCPKLLVFSRNVPITVNCS